MSRELLHIDFEVEAELSLQDVGAHRYAAHAATRPICMAYAWGNEEPRLWWAGEPIPLEVKHHVEQGRSVAAWNAWGFERLIWRQLALREGWPVVRFLQWVDPQAWSRAMGLPGGLDAAAKALGLAVAKDPAGARLIRDLCIRPPGAKPVKDYERKRQQLGQYCRQDVRVEREVMAKLTPLSPEELAVLRLDAAINDRGLGLDVELVRRLADVAARETARLSDRIRELTYGAVPSAVNHGALTQWLRDHGLPVASVDKSATAGLLASSELPPVVREVLELRAQAAKASAAKLTAMFDYCMDDGRMRGLFTYHGASTGRWTSTGVQVQNLPRDTVADPEGAIAAVMAGDDLALQQHGPVMHTVSRLLRGCIVPAPGHAIYSCDLAGIESRVLSWLAGDLGKLQRFRERVDPYKHAAAAIYGCGYDEVTKARRQIGKVAELALGFQGGVGAFQTMAKAYGVTVDDTQAQGIVRAWREAHPLTVRIWRSLERAAREALEQQRRVRVRHISYWPGGGHLWCQLPSGRLLCYPNARLGQRRAPWGEDVPAVEYETRETRAGRPKGWVTVQLYGGLATENVVQAVARDVLLEGVWRLEGLGYRVVGTVHDEVLVEHPLSGDDEAVARSIRQAMIQPAAWAADLPLDAEADGPCARYRK